MFKVLGGLQGRRKIHLLSITCTLLIALTSVGSNYSLITTVDGRYLRKISTELISKQSQNASLLFIPQDIIRNHKFPVIIRDTDQLPRYYNASWESDLLEINKTG